MRCAEFLDRLDAGEPLDRAEAREHAAACASCRLALERWQAATGGLRAWRDEAAPPFLHARIMAGLRAQPAPRPWWAALWPARRPAWALSAVATVFVAAIGGLVVWHAGVSPRKAQAPATLEAARSGGAPESAPSATGGPEAFSWQAPALESSVSKGKTAPAAPPTQARLEQEERLAEPARQVARAEESQFPDRSIAADRLERKAKEEARQGRVAQGLAEEGPHGGFAPEPLSAPAVVSRPQAAVEPAKEDARRSEAANRPAPAAQRPSGASLADKDTAERLRSLGYVQSTDAEAAPGETRRMDEQAKKAMPRAAAVRCRVVPLAGGVVRTVSLSFASAPKSDQTWMLRVDDDGGVHAVVEHGLALGGEGGAADRAKAKKQAVQNEPLTTIQDAALDSIKALALPPGRYRIERDQ
jgi:hypothetical protein